MLSPAALPEWIVRAVNTSAAVVVRADNLRRADPHSRVSAVMAALTTDIVVAVVPATVGVDPVTAEVWRAASAAGVARAVIVTELGPGAADFEDIAAITQRVFGEECVIWRLPVFDDDEGVIGNLDLADGMLRTAAGAVPSGRAHRRVAVGPRLRLIEALAVAVDDEAIAAEAVAVADQAEPDDPDADETVWGSPSLWDVSEPLAASAATGELAPVLAAAPDGDDVAGMLGLLRANGLNGRARFGAPESDELFSESEKLPPRATRRDAADEPTDGPAAVVLAVDGEWALVRRVYGEAIPTRGLLTLTRSGVRNPSQRDAEFPTAMLAPYRAWPVGVVETARELRDARHEWLRLSMLPAVGDVLTDRYLWLVDPPEEW